MQVADHDNHPSGPDLINNAILVSRVDTSTNQAVENVKIPLSTAFDLSMTGHKPMKILIAFSLENEAEQDVTFL
jgi:hypothetical protein